MALGIPRFLLADLTETDIAIPGLTTERIRKLREMEARLQEALRRKPQDASPIVRQIGPIVSVAQFYERRNKKRA
jgi:hypothetical protein